MTAERIVTGTPDADDEPFETSLRPPRLEGYIGQNKVKDNLRISIAAAQQRGEPPANVQAYGPPGLDTQDPEPPPPHPPRPIPRRRARTTGLPAAA